MKALRIALAAVLMGISAAGASIPLNQEISKGGVSVRVVPMDPLPLTDKDYVAQYGAFVYVRSASAFAVEEIRVAITFRLTDGSLITRSATFRPTISNTFVRKYFPVGVIEQVVSMSVIEVPASVLTDF